MCHNDLLLANFLFDSKANKVTIIDYEYLAANPAAFDIANHFNEYAGTDEVSAFVKWKFKAPTKLGNSCNQIN